jgi:hypothetical protein
LPGIRLGRRWIITRHAYEQWENGESPHRKTKEVRTGEGCLQCGGGTKTLSMLLEEFLRQHVDEKLAVKTIERYLEQAAYLDRDLLTLPIEEVTPLHLSREWNRLLESGGHYRYTKNQRPLSAKMVRNFAGILSRAFSRAVRVLAGSLPSLWRTSWAAVSSTG